MKAVFTLSVGTAADPSLFGHFDDARASLREEARASADVVP
ncbi:hypothetical protein [Bradyrhizobium sp. CB3481]|nr:hypothetical protein [Bradyrhizobium sp. CB3481]WFU14557.1 hypothetical protein QA643_25865 [Bradyrhizobium sp. CB3481]